MLLASRHCFFSDKKLDVTVTRLAMAQSRLAELKAHLKEILKAKGVSSTELARRLGMKPTSIVPFTSDHREWNPTFATLVKIADALGITIHELCIGQLDEKITVSELRKEIRSEIESIKSSQSPIQNLPHELVDELRLVNKQIHFDILREVLRGFRAANEDLPQDLKIQK